MQTDNRYPSFTSYDYRPVSCVPVIASFDSEGHISPLYVRINGASCRISSYWIRSNSFSNIITYNCQVIADDVLQPVTVEYHVKECTWTVDKA